MTRITTRVLLSIVLGLALVLGCGGEHRAARDTYNRGVAALAKGELEDAEKLLLDARSQAGLDPALRFHAAYELGVAYAAHADKVKAGAEPDLAQALALAQQALSWFNDAARLRKDDTATQANLAVMRARERSGLAHEELPHRLAWRCIFLAQCGGWRRPWRRCEPDHWPVPTWRRQVRWRSALQQASRSRQVQWDRGTQWRPWK